MAVVAQAQELELDAPGRPHSGAVALRLRLRLGCLPIGQLQGSGWQGEGRGELLLHEPGEGGRIRGPQAHIFIEVETAPARQQPLPFLGGQGSELLPQGPVDRHHRAAGGQTQGVAVPQGLEQDRRHPLRHGGGIGLHLQTRWRQGGEADQGNTATAFACSCAEPGPSPAMAASWP